VFEPASALAADGVLVRRAPPDAYHVGEPVNDDTFLVSVNACQQRDRHACVASASSSAPCQLRVVADGVDKPRPPARLVTARSRHQNCPVSSLHGLVSTHRVRADGPRGALVLASAPKPGAFPGYLPITGLIRVLRLPKCPLRRHCIRRRESHKSLTGMAIPATRRGTLVRQSGP
jgi:hypothetical protein